ncbi:MAG: acetolactate decarboxylase [Proteobacteria bacterium]|nr:acetolactate decarboxylase [Pseudomonadota bacterium]MBU1610517.1 acetolactate decarboxylase [Pseudomonadota bacterium]
MKRIVCTLTYAMLLVLALAAGACLAVQPSSAAPELGPEPAATNTLFQVSTIQALLNGQYDGTVTFGSLLTSGDFGLGTFDKLDGEMIAFDGKAYQINASGKVTPVPATWTTPFAVVTNFGSDLELTFNSVKDFADLQLRIQKELPGLNLFYAIRIDGLFQYMKTRSVPAQTEPYPPLAEAAKHQSVFEMKDTSGTVVGFFTPEFGGKVNVPGFHMHYLDQSATHGGHILDLSAQEIVVKIDRTPYLFLNLPLATAGTKMVDRTHELDAIEK